MDSPIPTQGVLDALQGGEQKCSGCDKEIAAACRGIDQNQRLWLLGGSTASYHRTNQSFH